MIKRGAAGSQLTPSGSETPHHQFTGLAGRLADFIHSGTPGFPMTSLRFLDAVEDVQHAVDFIHKRFSRGPDLIRAAHSVNGQHDLHHAHVVDPDQLLQPLLREHV